jgi:large-conductance mechanosensitive channel
MSSPLTFIIPGLIVVVLVALIGALFGSEEKPTDQKPDAPTDAELLAREVRELKKRNALGKWGAA